MKKNDQNRAWVRNEFGETVNANGDSLHYGEFGPNTYGLMTEIDGKRVELCVREVEGKSITESADELLEKLAGGWRPVNW